MARTRQRLPTAIRGGTKRRVVNGGAPALTTQVNQSYIPEVMTDHLSPHYPVLTDGDLSHRKRTINPPRVSGTAVLYVGTQPFIVETYNEFLTTGSWEGVEPGGTNLDYWYTEAAAKVNPSAPITDVLASLLELVTEVGPLLKGIVGASKAFSDNIARIGREQGIERARAYARNTTSLEVLVNPSSLAGAYAGYQFSIAPLIGLLSDLMNLEDSLRKREAQQKKFERDGLSIRLEDYSYTSSRTVSLGHDGFSFPVTITTIDKLEVWMQADYTTNLPPPDTAMSVSERADFRRRTALGLRHAGLDTLWEAVPLSWLADYFFSIGTYLKASRNQVGYILSSTCVMACTEQKTRMQSTRISRPGWKTDLKLKGGYKSTILKQRKASPGYYVGLNWQFLTDTQVGILTSIGSALALSRKR